MLKRVKNYIKGYMYTRKTNKEKSAIYIGRQKLILRQNLKEVIL